jgi:hypothetical protein
MADHQGGEHQGGMTHEVRFGSRAALAAKRGLGRSTPGTGRHGQRPWRVLWAMYGRRPRCKGKESDYQRSVRVRSCIRPLSAAVWPLALM